MPFFTKGLELVAERVVSTTSWRAGLFTTGLADITDPDQHSQLSDVSAHEVAAAAYTQVTLANVSVLINATLNELQLECKDLPSFGSPATTDPVTTVKYVIVWENAGSNLLLLWDDVPNTPTNGVEMQWDLPAAATSGKGIFGRMRYTAA